MSPQPEQTPSIRIVPHVEGPRSLQFDIIEREVPDGTSIKIGRFTDKANLPNRVTFKSKVVSRGHAEIWSENGKFYIKDTKSSSGTFLNRSRLSAPGQESKPYPLKDGDIVQLGVDYQGGTEEIYRCVKMRIELNRSWQHKVNEFSINAMKQLKALTGPDAFKHQTQDCCICLCGIGPCQALFLAPCSHVFHYKCIRPLLSNHPAFLCPLCRSYANLDATIDNSVDWEQVLADHDEDAKKSSESKDEDNQKSEGKEKIDVTESTHSGSSSGILSFDSISINGKRLSELTGPERTELFKILQNPDTSSQKLISSTKNASYSATESSSTSALITHPISSASHSNSTSTTQAVPIPFRRQNASYVPDEDSNLLSRTLPSSPMQSVLSYYEDDCGPSATAPALRDQQSSPRLDEIAEEDEDGIHSFSFRGGNVRSEGSGSASGQDAGSSSDAMSDDGEELEAEPKFRIVSCQLIKGDEDIVLVSGNRGEKERNSMSREKNRDKNERRVKGKGVDRVIGRRKEGENFL